MNYRGLIEHFDVSRETFEKLSTYHDLLVKWQKKINLISPKTINDIWSRHIIDSLQLTPLIDPKIKNILDIGSGAGLPAIPIAIVTGRAITLIESDGRKAAFLEEARRQLSLNIQILNARVEDVSRETFELIMARACAPLEKLCSWSLPHLSPQGICLFPKGEQYAIELEKAQKLWEFEWKAITSITNPAAAIIEIKNLSKR